MTVPATPNARFSLDQLVDCDGAGVFTLPHEGTAATYLDGAERVLLGALRSVQDVSVFSPELRAHITDWASLYHLTPYRGTILDALGLAAPEARVLELGAGCGAVTRWLGEHFAHVDAVEGSLARAAVARERCRDLPGVRVSAANFYDLDFGSDFDLTTLIGVLEYSHLYHPTLSHDPAGAALDNLKMARATLREHGTLIIAIENKLGLKYLTGSHEDHASRRYEGIEGYPSRRSAVTFSAAELERMCLEAGFAGVDFYLPFPDYKLARTILAADAATLDTYPANWIETPFPDRAGTQAGAPFNESLALREIASAGLLRDLANSFVVVATNGDRAAARAKLGIEDGWVARHYSLDRRPAFAKRASLERGATGELVVRNTCAATAADGTPPAAAPLPAELGLAQTFAEEPFRRGHQALFEVHELAAAGRLQESLPALMAKLRDFLLDHHDAAKTDAWGVPLLTGDALDVTWWNVIVDAASGEWHSIDGEWCFAGLLPLDYVLWRGVLHASSRRPEFLAGSGHDQPAHFALAAVRSVLPAIGPERLALFDELESWLQRAAGAVPVTAGSDLPTPRVRELIALAQAPRSFQVLAFAEELVAEPGLLATYAAAFRPGDAATLVAYWPAEDASPIVPQLEAALAAVAAADPDVMLVAVPREELAERRLAGSAHALLTTGTPGRPAADPAGPFARLPRFDASAAAGAALRALAFPEADATAAEPAA